MPHDGATVTRMLHARFDAGTAQPTLELVSRVETRGRTTDWSQTAEIHEDPAVLQAALQGSGLKPLDGVVAERAARITQGAITDRQKVAPVNAALHGKWEGNRVAFNTASDLSPPGAEGALPFLMYPQGLTGQGRLDEPDPKTFAYEMTATAV